MSGWDSDNLFHYGATCIERLRFGFTVHDNRVIYVWMVNGVRYVSWHAGHVAKGDSKTLYVFKKKIVPESKE